MSDLQRSGRPVEVSNAVTENQIDTLNQEDRRITVSEIAVMWKLSCQVLSTLSSVIV